ncbi:uncharacterized protein LOC131957614 [Physella acuta]|uniref:uncharacterized protein LOC131957614 n=1 Tax=Physella acuta TaxID=109671 RepID=UPI0027DD3F0F|nr:uncharacterized protein LOC131957614 [Physella acuta]
MKEYENNLHTLNKEMRVYTDKTDHVTQEIKRHSDLISAIQEDTTNKFDKLLSKHVVTCKLLQQRLMPIDKIIEIYNQNYETREGKMKKPETVEKEVLKLSQNPQSIANQQVKPSTPGFIASQGRLEGKMYGGYQVFTFRALNVGAGVYHKSGGKTNWLGDVWTKSKSVEVSRNFEVRASYPPKHKLPIETDNPEYTIEPSEFC